MILQTLRATVTGRRIIGTLVILLGVAFLCSLGFWQIDRYKQRMALNARIDQRMASPAVALSGDEQDGEALDYQHVSVRGTFDSSQEILLRNREYGGAVGVHVLTPLRISGSDAAVLVDRGWIPMDSSDQETRQQYAAPTGEQTIEGIVRQSQDKLAIRSDPPLQDGETRLDAWFRVDIPRIQQQVPYRLLPLYVEEQPPPEGDEGLPARSATGDFGSGNHLSYAIQWFAFAAILVGVYLAWTYQQLKQKALAAEQAAADAEAEAFDDDD